jgi:pyrroline-5-carboxylate reductase
MTIAFLGGGRMAGALIGGLLDQDWPAGEIFVAEPDATARGYLAHRLTPEQIFSSATGLLRDVPSSVLVLAVKPKDIDGLLDEIVSAGPVAGLVLSIAAGIGTERIERRLGAETAIVRAMPNTPALVGRGVTVIAAGRHAGPEHLEAARRVFESVGEVLIVEEGLMDAVTAVSGSGPAYQFYIMKALIAAGIAEGLPPDVARRLVILTVAGAAELARCSTQPLEEMIAAVASKGGTTEAALEVLEAGGVAGRIEEAVFAARRRAEAIGRNA